MKVDRITHSKDIIRNFRLLDSVQPEVEPHDTPIPKTLPYRNKHDVDQMTRGGDITPYEFSKTAANHYLGFDPTGNSTIRSVDPQNITLESNIKWIG